MHLFGVALMALGAFGLLAMASHIAWQQAQTLRYLREIEEWAEDVEWH